MTTEAATPIEYLVRIRPGSKRETQVMNVGGGFRTFRRSKGWYGPIVDRGLIELLRDVPENELLPVGHPLAGRVFEVRPRDEVLAQAQREKEEAERAEYETLGVARMPHPEPTGREAMPIDPRHSTKGKRR